VDAQPRASAQVARTSQRGEKISLRPLKFKEAVADLLKVKPPAAAKGKSKA